MASSDITVSTNLCAGGDLPVTAADLAVRAPALAAAAEHLQQLQDAGQAGFLSLDWEGWEVPQAWALGRTLRDRASTLLVLGIGGSALGARALDRAVGPASGAPDWSGPHRLIVLDTVDPFAVEASLASLDLADAAVCVISKSGGTVETAALFRHVLPRLQAAREDWRDVLVFITDRKQGALRPLAEAEGLAALPIPDDVGGRFSVLTAVGMLPAAFAGVDVEGLARGAEAMKGTLAERSLANPAWALAAAHDAWWGHANISALLAYCDRLRSVGEWWQQLWGESLGKIRPDGIAVGWTPTVAMGPVDQHSQLQLWQEGPRDKVVTVLRVEDLGRRAQLGPLSGGAQDVAAYLDGATLEGLMDAERRGTTAALVSAGRPVIELALPTVDAEAIGALFVLLEYATALTGVLSGVDPFDQPGVEAGKRFAYGLMGRQGFADEGARARAILGG